MSGLPDWFLPYFPQLRAAPPWVTNTRIAAEHRPATIAESIAGPEAELAANARHVLEAGGCDSRGLGHERVP